VRLVLLLLAAVVGAYFTVPTQAVHEEAARVFLQANPPAEAPHDGLTLDDVMNFARGMFAGQGRYENYYVLSHYTLDMPGSAYLECFGAYTMVRCREVGAGAAS